MLGFVLFLILAGLVAGTGGIMPNFLPCCAIAACLALLVTRSPRESNSWRLWVVSLAFLAWVLFSVAPLPPAAQFLAGARRNAAFTRAEQTLSRLSGLREDADRLRKASPAQIPLALGAGGAEQPATAATGIAAAPPLLSGDAHPDADPDSVLRPGVVPKSDNFPPASLPGIGVSASAPGRFVEREDVTHLPWRLSLNLPGTLRFFLLAAGALGMFWVSASLGHTARRRLLKAMVVGGAAVVLFGLAGKYYPQVAATIPWQVLEEYGHPGSVWPFVNRNHFATFAAMLAPIALCLTIYPHLGIPLRKSRRTREPGRNSGADSGSPEPAEGQVESLPAEGVTWRHAKWTARRYAVERALYLTALVILVAGTFFSLSRGGILALLTGILVTVLYWLRGKEIAASTVATVLGVCVLLALLFLPSDEVQQRLETLRAPELDKSGSTRFQYWHDTMGIWKRYPIVGSGMEAFRTVFKSYQSVPSVAGARYAENEYVQLLADGGLASVAFAALLAIVYFRSFAGNRISSADYGGSPDGATPELEEFRIRPLKAAVLGAFAVVAFHSIFDFPCRIPLNAFTVAVILGMGMPKLAGRSQSDEPPPVPWWRGSLLFRVLAIALFAAVLLVANSVGVLSRQHDRDTYLVTATLPELTRALTSAPMYWYTWYELGRRTHDIAQRPDFAEVLCDPVPGRASVPGWLREMAAEIRANALGYDTQGDLGFVLDASVPNPAHELPALLTPAPDEQADDGGGPDPRSLLLAPAFVERPPLPAAEQALRQQLLEFSRDSFRQAAGYALNDYRTWWALATAELEMGNMRQAEEAFTRAVNLAPYLAPDAGKVLTEAKSRAAATDN